MSKSSTEKQINCRYRLIQSASLSKRIGITPEQWKNDLQITNFVLESGLDVSLLEHIAAWVWTFSR